MSVTSDRQRGFTVVEILIVIIVIGIVASIAIVGYGAARGRARQADITSDLDNLQDAVYVARTKTGKTLQGITGSWWTGQYCMFQASSPGTPIPNGTDFSQRTAMTQACWDDTDSALVKISSASGIDVTKLRDPWGRPYYIDENEGSGGSCSQDVLGWLSYPYQGGYAQNFPRNLTPVDPACAPT